MANLIGSSAAVSSRQLSRSLCMKPLTCSSQTCRLRASRPQPAGPGPLTGLGLRRCSKWRGRRKGVLTTAMMEPEGELVSDVDEGTRIKVTKEVVVYHAPKIPELQLKDMEGTVKQIVKKFRGQELSANLPYKVEFVLDAESEKPKKLLVHLDASEFEAIS